MWSFLIFCAVLVFGLAIIEWLTEFDSIINGLKHQIFIEDKSYDGTKPLCRVVLINPTDGRIIRQLIVQVYQCDKCSIHYLDPEDHQKHTLFFENVIVDISKIK